MIKSKTMDYNEASITRLKGLEGVRARPGMYISTQGINQIVKEIIDNSLDEILAGHNDFVGIWLDPQGYIWVWDHGRGIPVGPHPSDNKTSTLTIVFTEIHSGGKLEENSAYKYSLGTFGVGASVTNALSNLFEVYTFRRNAWWHQRFSQGKPVTAVMQKAPPRLPLPLTKGTLIRFLPDPSIFSEEEQLNLDLLKSSLDITTYFIPNATIALFHGQQKTIFHHPGGTRDYIAKILEETKSTAQGDTVVIQNSRVDIALQWSNYPEEWVYSYANASLTISGGTHLNGLRRAITDAITPHAGVRQQKFKAEDLRAGLVGAINVRLAQPEFDSQTKSRLITKDIDKLVYEAAFPELEAFFKKHKPLAKAIIERANAVRSAHEDLRISKEAAAGLKIQKGNKILLPVKLLDCENVNRQQCELYIIEGDSAKGNSKNARFADFQAVLPLKGKPPNACKEDLNKKVLPNERVRDILRALGWQPNYRQLRYGRIILLADADDDGHHITCLLIALLHRIVPEVFTGINGKAESIVYIVDAPLYTAQHNGQRFYGASLADISKRLSKGFHGQITRIKGWAECSPEVLEQIAFNPKSRRLIRVDAVDGARLQYFLSLMGEDTATRKNMLGI